MTMKHLRLRRLKPVSVWASCVKANFQPVPRPEKRLARVILSDANFVSVSASSNTLSCRYIHRFVHDYCDTFYPLHRFTSFQ